MNFYQIHIYPHLVDAIGNPSSVGELRRQIVPLAAGTVLEIGAGSGGNFAYYDAKKVSKVYALEPNSGMVRLAEKQRKRVGVETNFWATRGSKFL